MEHLHPNDILTRVARYNLIRNQRLVYIDVHEALHGRLAGPYVAVPNLVNIIARTTRVSARPNQKPSQTASPKSKR